MGSVDQAKDLVKFHSNYPPTVNGEQLVFSVSSAFNFLQVEEETLPVSSFSCIRKVQKVPVSNVWLLLRKISQSGKAPVSQTQREVSTFILFFFYMQGNP